MTFARAGVVAARVIPVVALLLAAPPAIASAQHNVVLTGRVLVKGADAPLGYAVIQVMPGAHEIFTTSDGFFTLRDLPAARLSITAKRIGYTPLDTTIDASGMDTVRVDLALSLVTVRLPAIQSLAHACAHPGAGAARYGLELAALFEQMQQNAERNRLLAREYPFEVEMERRISRPEPALEARFVAYDTVVRSSERSWHYAPGHLVGAREYEAGVFAGKWTTLTLPELPDYADARFLDAHCFDYSGIDIVNGDSLLRIDFSPAASIHTPDVGGYVLLDPRTFQLRSMMVSLVNLTRAMRKQISGQSVHADFKEVIPGVPVLDRISSIIYPIETPDAPPGEPATETQRALRVRFLRGTP